MSKRTALIALTIAALTMMSTAAPASAREVVRYNAEVQSGTIVVKTAERWLYLVLGMARRSATRWRWVGQASSGRARPR